MNNPACDEEVAAFIREDGPPVIAQGAGTKAPLCRVDDGVRGLGLSGLNGIVEYEPSEYVISARAGTPLSVINQILRDNDQCLPFDPPLAKAGATLGGTVAAGLSGPGMVRYGGLRDFIIGVRFVSGEGKIVKGGGKVVKNAAGFDLPKFLAGSLGRFAVLLEITFKVFPRPEDRVTLDFTSDNLAEGLGKLFQVSLSKWEPEALELEADGRLFIRLAGDRSSLSSRANEVLNVLGRGVVLDEDAASAYWGNIAEFSWASPDSTFAKVPISPRMVTRLDNALESLPVERRYGMAGNVAWVAWSDDCVVAKIDAALRELDLPGLVVRGESTDVFIGFHRDFSIHSKVKDAFDPGGRFPPL